MQTDVRVHPSGPVIIYRSPASPDPNAPSEDAPPAPSAGPQFDIIGLLSHDPDRSKGDEPLYGAAAHPKAPIFGTLPVLGKPSPSLNAFERNQAGLWSLPFELSPEQLKDFLDYMDTASGPEKTWFELNPGTWPVIKINGAQKLAAARSIKEAVDDAFQYAGPKRRFAEEQIQYLKDLDAQVRSDSAWHTSNAAAAMNVLAGTINAFSNFALGILDAFPKPGGLLFSALYASIDDVFRRGAIFEESAWRDAIYKAMTEAAADDVLAGEGKLRPLLIEFSKLAQRLLELQDNERDRIELKREIERQLDQINQEIQKYQKYLQKPQLVETVAQELYRQPNYVISVATMYEYLTGKKVASMPGPGRTLFTAPSTSMRVAAALSPFALLLMIRGRERQVRSFESVIPLSMLGLSCNPNEAAEFSGLDL